MGEITDDGLASVQKKKMKEKITFRTITMVSVKNHSGVSSEILSTDLKKLVIHLPAPVTRLAFPSDC